MKCLAIPGAVATDMATAFLSQMDDAIIAIFESRQVQLCRPTPQCSMKACIDIRPFTFCS